MLALHGSGCRDPPMLAAKNSQILCNCHGVTAALTVPYPVGNFYSKQSLNPQVIDYSKYLLLAWYLLVTVSCGTHCRYWKLLLGGKSCRYLPERGYHENNE
jgi:hypothetical protein